jgi:hypothetical protein
MSEHPGEERLRRIDGGMVDAEVPEAYREYHDALKAQDPPPPAAWADLRPRMARRGASWRAWAAVAAAAVVAIAAYSRLTGPAPVRAAELLRKAVAAERPVTAPGRIRVKTAKREIVRRAVLAVPPAGELEALFVAARFSWQEPFSARSFAAWRDGLAEKRDSVRQDAGRYEIETTTSHGPLRSATLVLDQDLRPVRETLVFTGERVEIVEAQDEPEPGTVVRSPAVRPPAAPVEAGPGAELRVLAALHAIDADLGEPVQVVRDAQGVVVTASGLTPARERAVRDAVASVPGVVFRITEPPQGASSPAAPGTVARPAPSQLVGILGEDGVNRILDASEAVMARAFALRGLSRRFPPVVEAQLADADRDVLVSLQGEHVAGIRRHLVALRSSVAPLLPKPAEAQVPPAADWHAKAERLFAAAQAVDHLLNRVLAGGQDVARLAPELADALARLEAEARP